MSKINWKCQGKPCPGWKKCAGYDWFSYQDICFCSWQVLWILATWFDLTADGIILKELKWISSPDDSLPVDMPTIRKGGKNEPQFVKPALIVGEVHARLDKTGRGGLLLLAEVKAGMVDSLESEAKNALYYISGWGRKWIGKRGKKGVTFAQWCANRAYRSRRTYGD